MSKSSLTRYADRQLARRIPFGAAVWFSRHLPWLVSHLVDPKRSGR